MKKTKTQYFLAIFCTLIPLSNQIFWYISFQKFRNQKERIEYFMSVFTPITHNPRLIILINIIFCIASIILTGLLIKNVTGIKKILLYILLIISITLIIINLLQIQV